MTWIARAENGNERECESRSEAESVKSDMEDLGMDVEIIKPATSKEAQTGPGTKCEECGTDIPADAPEDATLCNHHGSWALANPPETDGGAQTAAEVMEAQKTTVDTSDETNAAESDVGAVKELPEEIPVDTDPLDVLPGYMITHVEGKPTLNKRGVSVLAYHFGVSVTNHEVLDRPGENGHEHAAVRITVEIDDGRRFVGMGEAHVDTVDKDKLLRMAETRAYKRAVIFATGTGIVGYQEIMNSLE